MKSIVRTNSIKLLWVFLNAFYYDRLLAERVSVDFNASSKILKVSKALPNDIAAANAGFEQLSYLTIRLLAESKRNPNLMLDELSEGNEGDKYVLRQSNPTRELATLSIRKSLNCYTIHWQRLSSYALNSNLTFIDCVDLDVTSSYPHSFASEWYGGAELFSSHFASSVFRGGSRFPLQPFISSDIFNSETKLGGVLAAQWFHSHGWSVGVPSSSISP